MDIGYLGTERLSWRRLNVLIGGFQTDPKYVLHKKLNPDWQWGLLEQLVALGDDLTAMGNWQRGGKKSAPKPKPIKRPGAGAGQSEHIGTTEMSVFDADVWLSGAGQSIAAIDDAREVA